MIVNGSGISSELARLRGYRTVKDRSELRSLGFAEYQCEVPALLVPIYRPGDDEPSLYQSRPDAPREEKREDGRYRRIKYETPAKARMALDVHPAMSGSVGDPNVPLWITEGVKKGDSLASRGLCAISLIGVWNWRGTNEMGGKTALAEWEDVALNGREVYIAFDSDAMTKVEVASAAARLKAFLERRGASVKVVYLSGGEDGRKQGVDDFLVAGGTVEELRALATPTIRPVKKNRKGHLSEVSGDEEISGTEMAISRVHSARELMARDLPPVRWVVPKILPEGVTLLAGKAKVRKSWLAMGLCFAVASGGYALGRIPVERGECLYAALEDNERRIQARLGKVLGGEECPEGFFYTTEFPRLDEGGVPALCGWLEEHPDCRLVVIDTLAKVRPRPRGLSGGYQEDYEALEGLLPVASRYRVAIVVVTHTRKAGATDILDEINATMGLMGGVDGFMVMRSERGGKEATMYVDGRDIEEAEEMQLKWDVDITGWRYAGSAEDTRLTEDRRLVLDTLNEAGEPMRFSEIARETAKPKQAVTKLLGALAFDGRVERVARGLWRTTDFLDETPIGSNPEASESNPEDESNPGRGLLFSGSNPDTYGESEKSNPSNPHLNNGGEREESAGSGLQGLQGLQHAEEGWNPDTYAKSENEKSNPESNPRSLGGLREEDK